MLLLDCVIEFVTLPALVHLAHAVDIYGPKAQALQLV